MLAFALGQLREQIPEAVHGAALAVRPWPELLDSRDQAGRTVDDDQLQRPEAAARQVAAQGEPVLL